MKFLLGLFLFFITTALLSQPVVQPVYPPKNPSVLEKKSEIQKLDQLPDQAILPIGLIKNKIEALKTGETCFVGFSSLVADGKQRCWLNPYGLTGAKNNDKIVMLRRDDQGFHVTIEKTNHQWEAMDIDGIAMRLIPVKSVQVKE